VVCSRSGRMTDRHPDRLALAAFMRGENSPIENREIVQHLIGGCSECSKIARSFWPVNGAGESGSAEMPYSWTAEGHFDVTEAFERVLRTIADEESALDRERVEAPRLFEELESHPAPRRQLLARNSVRFQTWSLCELVIDKGFEAGFVSPPEAVELAELGVAIAETLDLERYSSSLVRDLQARAWSVVGNARRLIGELRGAEEAFGEAEELLDGGTGDVIEEARLYSFTASLRSDQRRFDEAIRLAGHAETIYRRAGDHHLMARSMVSRGLFTGYSGDCEGAIPILESALAHLEPEHDRRVALAAQHNLIFCLNECGRLQEALKLLVKARPLYAKYGDPWSRTGLRWLEGKIATGLERAQEAEHAFAEARRTYLELERPLDFALVSLDLAALHLGEGQTDAARQVASEILPIFRSREIEREAIAAVIVFQQAVDKDRITYELIHRLSKSLEESRDNPRRRKRASAQ
jgi:tetratricopeptide (TPR) repeat protein